MKIRTLLGGISSHIPGIYKLFSRGTGGTISARYCYSVWLRHLVMAYKNGLSIYPETIAELGPGDSIGIGLAALLSGVNKYYAFDIIEYASSKRNIELFNELVDLFKKREKIPDETEFLGVRPLLESYKFPSNILTNERLDKTLKQDRIESIKNALQSLDSRGNNNIQISYLVPWYNSNIIEEESIDMIYSQAVLEHVDNLEYTYKVLCSWLKLGGFMSNEIDFACHGMAKEWNGHWAYSDIVWKLMKGKKPYLINRQPHSTHIDLMRKSGFEIIYDSRIKNTSGIRRKHLASKFKNISNDDLVISSAFIQAIKK